MGLILIYAKGVKGGKFTPLSGALRGFPVEGVEKDLRLFRGEGFPHDKNNLPRPCNTWSQNTNKNCTQSAYLLTKMHFLKFPQKAISGKNIHAASKTT